MTTSAIYSLTDHPITTPQNTPKVVHKQSGAVWALFRCQGDLNDSDHLSWSCPLFNAAIHGGWFKPSYTQTKTGGGWEPTLCMVKYLTP